jgi:hypothetical protein
MLMYTKLMLVYLMAIVVCLCPVYYSVVLMVRHAIKKGEIKRKIQKVRDGLAGKKVFIDLSDMEITTLAANSLIEWGARIVSEEKSDVRIRLKDTSIYTTDGSWRPKYLLDVNGAPIETPCISNNRELGAVMSYVVSSLRGDGVEDFMSSYRYDASVTMVIASGCITLSLMTIIPILANMIELYYGW